MMEKTQLLWSAEAKLQQAEAPLPHSKAARCPTDPTHKTKLRSAEAKLQQAEAPLPHSKTKRCPTDPTLYRACKEFEAIFVLQLWRAMQRTIPNQRKTLNYTDMFDLQFADYLAQRGQFGLAEQLYEQLSRHMRTTGGDR